MKVILFLTLVAAVFSQGNCGSIADEPPPRAKRTNTVQRDPKPWEKVFFTGIGERLAGSGIDNLRDIELAGDSMEIRVWAGFDNSPLRGLILRRHGGEWRASYLRASGDIDDLGRGEILLPSPKKGWQNLWQRLNDLRFLELPDATEIGMEHKYFDSRTVVVEIAKPENYRTYHLFGFNVPDELKREPVRNLIEISNLLSEEFGVQLYYYFDSK